MKKALAALLLGGLAGCASVGNLVRPSRSELPPPGPHVFGGARNDWIFITEGPRRCKGIAYVIFGAIDLPWSVAMDVVLLPVTGSIALSRELCP